MSIYYTPGDEDVLRKYKDGGVVRALFGLPSEPRDKVLPMLDNYAALMRKVG